MAAELESMRLKEAAKVVREGFTETLTYCEMPRSIGGVPASSALSPMESRLSC